MYLAVANENDKSLNGDNDSVNMEEQVGEQGHSI